MRLHAPLGRPIWQSCRREPAPNLPQSADSAGPLYRAGIVKGRVDGGGRPRRIARTLCVFAEKGGAAKPPTFPGCHCPA